MNHFPLGETAVCVDCEIVFCIRDRVCPTCGGDSSIYLINKHTPKKTQDVVKSGLSEILRIELDRIKKKSSYVKKLQTMIDETHDKRRD